MNEAQRLSEDEKTNLVLKYRDMVKRVAHRYHFLDKDFDNIQGGGFLGLAKAIVYFETNPNIEIESIAYSYIRKAILHQYVKKNKANSEISLQSPLTIYGDNDGGTLEDVIQGNAMHLNECDIQKWIRESLFEWPSNKINMVTDYLLTEKSLEEIAKEHQISMMGARKIQKQGNLLIKRYLYNNSIILDYLSFPSEEERKEKKVINHRALGPDDYGIIKYIVKYFPDLTKNDIARLSNTSSYMIQQLLDHPTAAYLKATFDGSIQNRVVKYYKMKYPERLPGKVIVYKKDNKNLA
ncbi:hypothetical protein [Sutcliffiella halmapala]|uniref:hypothetical protein n=1 Tax=Sutcliffiella halmapala TaxID=79882 RepID=UPI0009956705|nr:hypothetical protein [Sutcliffiella halmapala]